MIIIIFYLVTSISNLFKSYLNFSFSFILIYQDAIELLDGCYRKCIRTPLSFCATRRSVDPALVRAINISSNSNFCAAMSRRIESNHARERGLWRRVHYLIPYGSPYARTHIAIARRSRTQLKLQSRRWSCTARRLRAVDLHRVNPEIICRDRRHRLDIARVIIILFQQLIPATCRRLQGRLAARLNFIRCKIIKKEKINASLERMVAPLHVPLFIRKAETRDEFKFTTCETLLNIHNSSATARRPAPCLVHV